MKNIPSAIMNKKKENKNSEEIMLQELCELFNDNKAENIVTLDMKPIYGYESWFVIVTALSAVHLKKLAHEAMYYLKKQDIFLKTVPTQTDIDSGWVVLDCNGIIVHLFLKQVRDLYNLEELWIKAPKTAFSG